MRALLASWYLSSFSAFLRNSFRSLPSSLESLGCQYLLNEVNHLEIWDKIYPTSGEHVAKLLPHHVLVPIHVHQRLGGVSRISVVETRHYPDEFFHGKPILVLRERCVEILDGVNHELRVFVEGCGNLMQILWVDEARAIPIVHVEDRYVELVDRVLVHRYREVAT